MSATELSDYAAKVGPTYAVNAVVEASPSPRPAPQAMLKTRSGPRAIAVAAPVTPTTPEHPPVVLAPPPAPGHPVTMKASAQDARTNSRMFTGIQLARITGEPKPSQDAAREDAIRKAKIALIHKLEQLDPPVLIAPSVYRVQNEYCSAKINVCVADDPKWEELKRLNGGKDLYVAEVSVELTDDQVRQLRQEERVQTGLIGVGGLAVGALVTCGLMRAGSAAGRLTRANLPATRTLLWAAVPILALILLFRNR
jgi:hypothetical protein